MKRKRTAILLIVFTVGAWVISGKKRSPAAIPSLSSHGRGEAAQNPVPAASSPAPLLKPVTPSAPVAENVPMKGTTSMSRSYEYTEEVEMYARLTAKAFLTPAEEQTLHGLVRDENLLKSLTKVLLEPAWTHERIRQQDAAIEILIAGLRGSSSAAAASALRSVVEDRQIENPYLAAKDREQLAGLKAEVLFLWSSSSPEMASNIRSWLPGPVSIKIWSNVIRMQKANVTESQEESHHSGD